MASYLEQTAIGNALNFSHPIAWAPSAGPSAFWPYDVANTTAMATRVALFLCPSDGGPSPDPTSGPSNYAFCTGTGINGGDATNADGTFLLGPAIGIAAILDGTSNTAAASEQVLGIPGSYTLPAGSPTPSPLARAFARMAAGPLTDAGCLGATDGWLTWKGANWWDGNYLNTLYNHYLTPNTRRADCITYHNPGWKAARSFHPGAVNVLYCDGGVRPAKDTVDPGVWRSFATRAGGEIIDGGSLRAGRRGGEAPAEPGERSPKARYPARREPRPPVCGHFGTIYESKTLALATKSLRLATNSTCRLLLR